MSNLQRQGADCSYPREVPLTNMKRNTSRVNNTYEVLLISIEHDRSGYVRNICTSVVECFALEAGRNCRKGSKLCENCYLIFRTTFHKDANIHQLQAEKRARKLNSTIMHFSKFSENRKIKNPNYLIWRVLLQNINTKLS